MGCDKTHPCTPIRVSFLQRCSRRSDSSVSLLHHITFTSSSLDDSLMHAKLLSVMFEQKATDKEKIGSAQRREDTPRSVIMSLSSTIERSLGVSQPHSGQPCSQVEQ